MSSNELNETNGLEWNRTNELNSNDENELNQTTSSINQIRMNELE